MLSSRTVHIVISALIFGLFFCELCNSQGNQRRRPRNRNTARRDQAELPTVLHTAYHNAFDDQISTPAPPLRPGNVGHPQSWPQPFASRNIWNNDWDRYTPSTPASNNIDCYVEVISIQHLGGVCTQLGGTEQPYICQSGRYFDFRPECRQIVNARQRSGS